MSSAISKFPSLLDCRAAGNSEKKGQEVVCESDKREDQVVEGRNGALILPRGEYDAPQAAKLIRRHYAAQPPRLDLALAARIPGVPRARQGRCESRPQGRRTRSAASASRDGPLPLAEDADEDLAALARGAS
jgi:hypothetical protein